MSERGFSLLELMMVVALSSFLLLGLVQLMSAGSAASLHQDELGRLQESARQAVSLTRKVARPAGFSPAPWDGSMRITRPLAGSQDSVSASSDRLVVTQWSDLNCFDYRNPETDSSGSARFYLRETQLDLTSSHHLALQCRYGPDPDSMTTQIPRQGRVPGIRMLQFEYGLDLDANGEVDSWSPAGDWSTLPDVLGIKAKMDVTEGTLKESLEFHIALPGQTG